MRYKLHSSLLAFSLALTTLGTTAYAFDDKTGYAVSDNQELGIGLYSFELGDTIKNFTLVQSLNADRISSGYLLGDTYYYIDYSQVINGYKVNGLYAYDMESKNTRMIADYGATLNGAIAGSMSYDYQTQTMYGLDFFNGGSSLVTVDLDNGTIKTTQKLTFDTYCEAAKANNLSESIHVMTSNYDGDFYGVSYWGALYKINQYTGLCQYIGTLDYNPGTAFMYTGDDLFFDEDTNRLFMRFTYYNWGTSQWGYELVQIDTKTAHVTKFAALTSAYNTIHGINVPFTVAAASAPAKVQNLTLSPVAPGSLSVTLNWDNPAKTYGRGGTLENLDYVLVYRDGVKVDSIVNPAVGGHQTWTDNSIAERGFYTYKIVPGNDMGRGDRASVSSYIGNGDPLGVSDFKAAVNGDGTSLSWTAPTKGKLDSYINTDALTYDVIRFANSDTQGTRIAQGIKANSYDDNSLDSIAKYRYAVVAHTERYASDSIWAEPVVAGPAIKVPATIGFADYDQFGLWTVVDANGNNNSWNYQPAQWNSMAGAYVSYNYDNMAAADWLISPRVRLEAGKHYKLTFDAQPGSKKVIETLAVSMGQGSDIAVQDSIDQFDIASDVVVNLRTNLPVVKTTGDYNLGLLYRSYISANYKLTVNNIKVEEDHEGYISGKALNTDGSPIAGAAVYADAGAFAATTDANGAYTLKYLPQGKHTVNIKVKGYEDQQHDVDVEELATATLNFNLVSLPTYTIKGVVKDVAGDPVAGADVALTGYDETEAITDAEGRFSIASVYKNANYSVAINKNKFVEAKQNFGVDSDVDLGTIVLDDNVKPVQKVKVDAAADKAEVTWEAPANDPVVQRIDDGTLTTAVGVNGGNSNTMFGVVKREPSIVNGVQFYIDGTATVTHYSVQLTIFDLDENGEPTTNVLYKNTYVPATDGQWNSYTLPAPIDAPNGYYMAISYYDYLLVGIDGDGDSQRYPFVKRTNCFTPDYTTGKFYYLDDQSTAKYHHNFLIRPVAAPVTVAEDATEFTAPRFMKHTQSNGAQPELESKQYGDTKIAEPATSAMLKTIQSRIRYNVYRMKSTEIGNQGAWQLVSEKQQPRSFTDNDWASLAQGSYAYAVKAVYTGDKYANVVVSDTIGNKMFTTVKLHVTTNTPDNESYGAHVQLVAGGGMHVSDGTVDDNGDVEIENVWKANYNLTISLDGFVQKTDVVDLSNKDSYSLSYALDEDRKQPRNLYVEDGATADSKVFAWNYPDVFFDDFESHADFAINSPGSIGWQYIDGDGVETGAVYNYTWDGLGSPMAYMVFNASATSPSLKNQGFNLEAYSGEKCLTDWAAYNVPNDDWIITPQLHFNSDFKFSFYAAGLDYQYPETFEVLYSTTDARPESFVAVGDASQTSSYYMQYSYDIPKEAKYVAIHCTSDQMRVLRIDDVRFGLPEAMQAPFYLSPYAGVARKPMRSPSLDGLYEVYLDGKLVAQQDETSYLFEGLANGTHTAGVLASYTSGKTEMSTIDFTVDVASGVNAISGNQLKVTVDNGVVSINGNYTDLHVFAADGKSLPLTRIASNAYRINGASGVVIVKVDTVNGEKTMKVNVK